MMVAKEVAIAIWRMCSCGNCFAVKIIVMNGTSSIPPPMPSKPAAKPTAAPSASSVAINVKSIQLLPLFKLPDDTPPLGRRYRRDRKPVAAPEYLHISQLRERAQFRQRHQTRLA